MSMLLNGVSGLNAANSALGAVSQNVANAAVKGYSRQTVYLETAAGGLNGVKVTKIDRIVNSFLNDDIWRTSADTGYYEGFQNYIGYLEQIQELIPLGAYQPGKDTELDNAVAMYPKIEAFLCQGLNEQVDFAETEQQLTKLAV